MSVVIVPQQTATLAIVGTSTGAGAKGDPGSPGSGYATRSALATAGNTAANLDEAFLAEAGVEGMFVYSATDLSAKVAIDTQQALYVADAATPSGAAGAWVRQVPNLEYNLRWWLGSGTSFTGGDVLLNKVNSLLPNYSKLVFPGDVNIQIDALVRWTVPGLELDGRWCTITHNSALTPFTMFQIGGSFQKFHHFKMVGKPDPLGAAGLPSCVHVSTNGQGDGITPVPSITDIEVHSLVISNTSLPIVFFGDPTENVGVNPVQRVKAWNLDLTTSTQGMSIFGADDVEVHSFKLSYSAAPDESLTQAPAIRILGSKRVHIHDGQMYGPVGGPPSISTPMFRLGAAMLGSSNETRRVNEDVTLENMNGKDFWTCAHAEECIGRLTFRNIVCEGYPSSSVATGTFGLRIQADGTTAGVAYAIGDVIIDHVTTIGMAQGVNYYGTINTIVSDNYRHVMNAAAPDESVRMPIVSLYGGPLLVHFKNASLFGPVQAYPNVFVGAGHFFVIENSRYSESGTPGTPLVGNIGISVGGTGTATQANCYKWMTGTHAAMT